ncbi:MAG: PH domain-containing protein [Saprospiraceae bacterium]|nr:PH domain-containing protein [Saprospiraceae bacterium]
MSEFSNTQLDLSALPTLDAVEFQSIQSRYRYALYGSTSVFFLLVLIGLVIASLIIWGPLHWLTFLSLIGWLVLYLLSLWFASERVRRMSYAIREQDVSYQEGVFFRDWTTIPFNRIQHCEVSKGVFESFVKLSTLKIFTAGGSDSDISIRGLATDEATRLRDFIIHRIQITDEEE